MSILQIKISLRGSKPRIWRRFLVSDSLTFNELNPSIIFLGSLSSIFGLLRTNRKKQIISLGIFSFSKLRPSFVSGQTLGQTGIR